MVDLQAFSDRREAGRVLAAELEPYAKRNDVVVLALPRGGVPVAYEIATALHAPLDVLAVRKLGVPGREELAMGAIASGGAYSLDTKLIRYLGLTADEMLEVVREAQQELERREAVYRDHRHFPRIEGRTVIIVDDGLATGQTMAVAVEAVRKMNPKQIIVAVPVCTHEAQAELSVDADVICALTPDPFYAVGAWYKNFAQVSDDEVRELLARAAARDPKA